MAFVTMLHLQASADVALSCKPGRPVTRGGHGNHHNQRGHSYSPKESRIQSFMKGDLKKHNIFLILTLVFTSIAKRSKEFNLKT